ncbi:MAG: hypothetical protein K0A92_08410 [Methyloprofundus sp.]|nr:hypothetical protein [Methyloprofundus sp.]
MFIIFLILLVGLIWLDHIFFMLAPLVLASIYALVLAPGAFWGGNEIDKEKLIAKLKNDWNNPEEIAIFIKKYWFSIKFSMSAQKRGANASSIAIGSMIIAIYMFIQNINIIFTIWSLINCITLWLIGNRVNKSLFLIRYFPKSKSAELAAASYIAVSKSMNHSSINFIVESFIPVSLQDRVKDNYIKKEDSTDLFHWNGYAFEEGYYQICEECFEYFTRDDFKTDIALCSSCGAQLKW